MQKIVKSHEKNLKKPSVKRDLAASKMQNRFFEKKNHTTQYVVYTLAIPRKAEQDMHPPTSCAKNKIN